MQTSKVQHVRSSTCEALCWMLCQHHITWSFSTKPVPVYWLSNTPPGPHACRLPSLVRVRQGVKLACRGRRHAGVFNELGTTTGAAGRQPEELILPGLCTKNRVKSKMAHKTTKVGRARMAPAKRLRGSLRGGPRGEFGRGLQPVRAWFASLRPYAMQGPAASKNQQLVANRREGHEVGRGEQRGGTEEKR